MFRNKRQYSDSRIPFFFWIVLVQHLLAVKEMFNWKLQREAIQTFMFENMDLVVALSQSGWRYEDVESIIFQINSKGWIQNSVTVDSDRQNVAAQTRKESLAFRI